jgi:hypothetical protein
MTGTDLRGIRDPEEKRMPRFRKILLVPIGSPLATTDVLADVVGVTGPGDVELTVQGVVPGAHRPGAWLRHAYGPQQTVNDLALCRMEVILRDWAEAAAPGTRIEVVANVGRLPAEVARVVASADHTVPS